MSVPIKPPFPYFGAKGPVADIVWQALGDVKNYIEPFFGSGAVYLNRPHPHQIATINDADGMVCNFWRAVANAPADLARLTDYPVSECDLHARHAWLVNQRSDLVERLEGDPEWYDAKLAGWWCWGLCCWIGSGWCSGIGPWHTVDGRLVKEEGDAGTGINRKRPAIGNAGRGVNRPGISRQRPAFGDAGRGVTRPQQDLPTLFQDLADRLAEARVCCGDWKRVCGETPTTKQGLTGMFLDPPYSHALRQEDLYAVETDCAAEVTAWCQEHGDDPLLRIVLAGYRGEHDALEQIGWTAHPWKARGGMGSQGTGRGRENAELEVLWMSPHCLKSQRQVGLFETA